MYSTYHVVLFFLFKLTLTRSGLITLYLKLNIAITDWIKEKCEESRKKFKRLLKKKVKEVADVSQSEVLLAPTDLLKYVAWRTNQTAMRLRASQNNKTTYSSANGSSNDLMAEYIK